MAFLKKSKTANTSSSPLPPKLTGLLRESWWLLVVAVALYFALILQSYDLRDPGWSHSTTDETIHNAGGLLGALVADSLLYAFGLSAYWWVVFALCGIWWGYKHIESKGLSDRRPLFVALSGFLLLLLASSSMEALRLYTWQVSLPYAHGGILGGVTSKTLADALGFTGATLFLLILFAVGVSLFTGLSWLKFMEQVGWAAENAYHYLLQRYRRREDKRVGEEAVQRRDEFVTIEKKRIEEHEPIRIEPPGAEVPKSVRVQREKQKPLFKELPDSPLPALELLDEAEADAETLSEETLEYTSRQIEHKLMDFGVEVKVIAAYPGPVITRYEMEPAVGVKGSQITNLSKDLARVLSVSSVRVVETIPNKNCMGLEIPNPKRQVVRLSEILSTQVYADASSPLTIALGKDISGKPVVADLARMPHLLVAGTTGSGKSVAINAMILSLLYKAEPSTVRLILVDPKMLELSVYADIPHLLAPVVTDMKQAAHALNWCVVEMDRRYRLLSSLGVRHLNGYNQKVRGAAKTGQPLTNPFSITPDNPEPLEVLPFIVVIIDELADLMMVAGKKVEELVTRLAQKARASGIHLILATQRPSVDVITGLIKANIPVRIAFQVSSKVDSRTILDQMGAESLLGQGDMLFLSSGGGFLQRVHGALVLDHEVHKVVDNLKAQGAPQYVDGILEGGNENNVGDNMVGSGGEADPLYNEAVAVVLRSRRASISLVQRQLRIGYNRAARLIEDMERVGLVSGMQANGNREVLAPAPADG